MIEFNPKKHIYFDNQGREYISVTSLLSKEFPFNGPEIAAKLSKLEGHRYYNHDVKEILKEWHDSAKFGTIVHNACEKYLKEGKLPEDTKLLPIIEQFKKLKFKGKILSETRVWDENYLVAGTVDLIEDCGNYCWLMDIKTSAKLSDEKHLKFSMQLEIYRRLIEKCLNKTCKTLGIIWFEDYVEQREKTKLKVVKCLPCKEEVDRILEKRKREIGG